MVKYLTSYRMCNQVLSYPGQDWILKVDLITGLYETRDALYNNNSNGNRIECRETSSIIVIYLQ